MLYYIILYRTPLPAQRRCRRGRARERSAPAEPSRAEQSRRVPKRLASRRCGVRTGTIAASGYVLLPTCSVQTHLDSLPIYFWEIEQGHVARHICIAETRDRNGHLQIFSLMLSQLSYRGL